MNNQTAVSFINRMEAFTPCSSKWCLRSRITLSAEYLAGLENIAADEESH